MELVFLDAVLDFELCVFIAFKNLVETNYLMVGITYVASMYAISFN